MRAAPLLLALALLAGCDGDGLADKTYPPAGDFPSLTAGALAVAPPGLYNTTAFVADVFVCPPEADCFSEGSVTLTATDSPETDPGPPAAVVWVVTPAQFETGRRGTFSVEVVGPTGGEDDGALIARLVGYDWR